jgi:hypothetical protein
MLDGLTLVFESIPEKLMDELKKDAVYTRIERMMDSEKHAFYLFDCSVWTVMMHFDPRRDQKHEHPRSVILHHVMTQYENFAFHQLPYHEIRNQESEMFTHFLSFQPKLIFFDLVLGVWDTESWRKIFEFYPFPKETCDIDDLHVVQQRIKFAQYSWKNLNIKFYRLNPEINRNHALKYPLGWAGYTKAEFVTPKLVNNDIETLKTVLSQLQNIREFWLDNVWQERNKQVATKTFARSDRIFAWSSTEQTLQGSMKLLESEMTTRKIIDPKIYMQDLESIIDDLEKSKSKEKPKEVPST